MFTLSCFILHTGLTAEKFNAETHERYFTDIVNNLGFEKVSDFAVAQTADSTALNPAIARRLGIHHVGCRNHCLNLGCKDMEQNDRELKSMTEDTQECHRNINSSNRLTAMLANVQDGVQKLKMMCKTRWMAVTDLFVSHVKSADDIRVVAEAHPDRVSLTIIISFYFFFSIS